MTWRPEDIAETWIGTPFIHQGRSRAGIDCIGTVYLTGLEAGADLKGYVDDPTYGRDPDGRLEAQIGRHLKRVSPIPSPLSPGQVLFFRFRRRAQHVGIVAADPRFFIHAYEPDGEVVKTRLDRRWTAFMVGVFEFHGVGG